MGLEPERAVLDPLHHIVGHDPNQRLRTPRNGATYLNSTSKITGIFATAMPLTYSQPVRTTDGAVPTG